jgi:menaquinone reductase, multiheme cytochrome c subunit
MDAETKSGKSGRSGGALFFFAGFVIAMVCGWVVFPRLLYSQKSQPVSFRHAAHQDSQCEDCHRFRADGTYSGIPPVDNCRQCHEQTIGETEAERLLVENYIEPDKEIPWHVYTRQPDNVYFSHAAHVKPDIDCIRCHRDVTKDEKLPVYQENRLTGYSISTMKMAECERCHMERHASNACQICHK